MSRREAARPADAEEYPKLFVAHEKHGDRHFLLLSEKDLFKVALTLTKERVEQGYFYKQEEPEKPTTEQGWIDSHPSIAVRHAARREWLLYKEKLSYANDVNEAHLLASAAVATGNGELALEAMKLHRDYEYEGYNVEKFERVED